MKPLLTVLPFFHGFYESMHSGKIDDAEAQLVADESGCFPKQGLENLVWQHLNYRKVFEGYARMYCDNFGELYKIPVRFESLTHPKEFNFETNRLYAHISLSTLKRIRSLTPESDLAGAIKRRFTSRDGFMSFYANDLQHPEWQVPMQDWDHNMIETLLEAYLLQEHSEEDIDQNEWDMVDDCNGDISNLVWEHLAQEAKDKINAAYTAQG